MVCLASSLLMTLNGVQLSPPQQAAVNICTHASFCTWTSVALRQMSRRTSVLVFFEIMQIFQEFLKYDSAALKTNTY